MLLTSHKGSVYEQVYDCSAEMANVSGVAASPDSVTASVDVRWTISVCLFLLEIPMLATNRQTELTTDK